MRETVPNNRRVYMVIQKGADGMMDLRLSLTPPSYSDPAAIFILRGVLPSGDDITLGFVSDPTADPALRGDDGASAYQIARDLGYGGRLASLKGKDAAGYVGTVNIDQTATAVIAAGVRRLVVPIPASLGIAAGDPIALAPTKAIEGYAIHDAVAVSATAINVGLTAPLLAVGASFSIPCKLFRFTT